MNVPSHPKLCIYGSTHYFSNMSVCKSVSISLSYFHFEKKLASTSLPKQLNELSWNLVGIEASAAALAEKLALSWKVISMLLWSDRGRFYAIHLLVKCGFTRARNIWKKKLPKKYLQLKPSLNFFCRNKKNYLIYNLFCIQKTKSFFVLNKLKFSKCVQILFLLARRIKDKSYYWFNNLSNKEKYK